MFALSPLHPQELRDISEALDAGNIADAAARLAALTDQEGATPAIDFLATRILFEKGRIDSEGARARLIDILRESSNFPEARSWLEYLTNPAVDKSPVSVDFDSWEDPEGEDETTPADGTYSNASLNSSAPGPIEPEEIFKPAPFDALHAKKRLTATAGRYSSGRSNAPGQLIESELEATAEEYSDKPAPPPGGQWTRDIDEALLHLDDGEFQQADRLIREQGRLGRSLPAPYDARFARILLFRGQVEEACSQAKVAWDLQNNSHEATWTYAWCLVRQSRVVVGTDSLEQARQLLGDLPRSSCSEPGLLEALGACTEARLGSPTVALQLAQRALRLKGDSLDALAALAESNAALGDVRRADAAFGQFLLQAPFENRALKARLRELGAGDQAPASTACQWHIIENALSDGNRQYALTELNELAQAFLQHDLGTQTESQATRRGLAASQFLRECPVFRLFGCYSFSTNDLTILDTCLALVFGDNPQPLAEVTQNDLITVVSDYLGETLHQAWGARWLSPESSLKLGSATVSPHQLVLRRIGHGSRATLSSAIEKPVTGQPDKSSNCGDAAPSRAIDPASRPPGSRAAAQFAPVALVAPLAWPQLDEFRAIGRSLSESVISAYCRKYQQRPLDRSLESLIAIDNYLALVTATSLFEPTDEAWIRWLATTVGGYLGEVLHESLDGQWVECDGTGANRYAVRTGESLTYPVQIVLDCVQAKGPGSLAQLASRLTSSKKAAIWVK